MQNDKKVLYNINKFKIGAFLSVFFVIFVVAGLFEHPEVFLGERMFVALSQVIFMSPVWFFLFYYLDWLKFDID